MHVKLWKITLISLIAIIGILGLSRHFSDEVEVLDTHIHTINLPQKNTELEKSLASIDDRELVLTESLTTNLLVEYIYGPGDTPGPNAISLLADIRDVRLWEEVASETTSAINSLRGKPFFDAWSDKRYTNDALRKGLDLTATDIELTIVCDTYNRQIIALIEEAEGTMLLEMERLETTAPLWLHVVPINQEKPIAPSGKGSFRKTCGVNSGGWHGYFLWDSADFPRIEELLQEIRTLRNLERSELRGKFGS